jgi:Fe-S cluster biogenesis protein NfuA
MITTEEKVNEALDSIRPFLQADGGDVELVDILDGIVRIKLIGACRTCDISHITMRAGVEESIKRALPEIREVHAVN